MDLYPSIVICHFVKLIFLIYVLIKKIAILLVPNNLTMLGMVLLTEFMTHPLSLLFCRLSNLLRDLLIFEVRNLSLFAI